MEKTMIDLQKKEEPVRPNPLESLHEPADSSLTERGNYAGHVARSSLYTKASLHPLVTGAAVAVGLGGAAFAVDRFRKKGNGMTH
jgi:hypothetical protein